MILRLKNIFILSINPFSKLSLFHFCLTIQTLNIYAGSKLYSFLQMDSLKSKFVLGAKYDDGKHKLECLALFTNIMPAAKTTK